ncbi:ribokinase [Bacillus sp. J14TS2]|uniref:ribokinase n=1 Tax=Bacillus sp. J14TS2 TaxID=2807188 RepID=UPI001B217132|nr:ribokinase [Bacillus sp. J14TS2]GIN69614.1 ribokinase [Bacillus sp. J14TS2]
MTFKPKITVVGSINMDLVTMTDKLPNKGETLLGQQFQMNPGGKGANQAIAAARLGARTSMIGCVGQDAFGKQLLHNLEENGVNVSNVEPVTDVVTGTATILVSDQDNRIIVTPGANDSVTVDFIESKREVIANSDVVILQLEIPLDSVIRAIEIAKEHHVKVILNPAPIRELPDTLIRQIDYVTPNEHEETLLMKNRDLNELQKKLIVTRGESGVSFYQNDKRIDVPAFKVDVKDTTGAGDAFNGGLAVALSKGLSLREACIFSSAVAAISITELGAQTGMPTEEQVKTFLTNN